MNDDLPARAGWRKSSFSTAISGGSDCLEVAALDDGRIALRDSKHPHSGILLSTRTEMTAFIRGIRHREFDDLAY